MLNLYQKHMLFILLYFYYPKCLKGGKSGKSLQKRIADFAICIFHFSFYVLCLCILPSIYIDSFDLLLCFAWMSLIRLLAKYLALWVYICHICDLDNLDQIYAKFFINKVCQRPLVYPSRCMSYILHYVCYRVYWVTSSRVFHLYLCFQELKILLEQHSL